MGSAAGIRSHAIKTDLSGGRLTSDDLKNSEALSDCESMADWGRDVATIVEWALGRLPTEDGKPRNVALAVLEDVGDGRWDGTKFVLRPCWQRRISSCPYCSKSHLHGAGGRVGDPRSSLGWRSSHCIESTGVKTCYELVDSEPARTAAMLAAGRGI
jgi:hypothetical protein